MEVLVGQGFRLTSILGGGSSSSCLIKSFPKSARYSLCTGSTFGRFDITERYPQYNIVPRLTRLSVSPARSPLKENANVNGIISSRYYTSQPPLKDDRKASAINATLPKKLSLVQRMKQLAKDYWYILAPVHLVTSATWMAIFYVAVTNGVDIASLLEYIYISQEYIDTIRNSTTGNLALAYLLFKIISPIRYMVTIGGTTLVIRKLDKRGILKASQLKQGIKQHHELKKKSSATKPISPSTSSTKTEKCESPKA